MISIVEAVKELDAALARNVALEVAAAEYRIRAQKAEADAADLRDQLKFVIGLTSDLMKMVDTLKVERDTWRAEASL